MSNINYQRRKSILPEVKMDRKKNLDPAYQDDLARRFKMGSSNLGDVTVRGHIVPGCSQVHNKSSDSSDKFSEEDLTKKKNSKLRTMKVQPINERSVLMEKFESSLKDRLLSSTSFGKQVPLFDSLSNKEKIRMKTPSADDDLSKNESVFNAVFPARKDSGRCLSPHINEELFSKHNRESQDWLKQIEIQVQKDKTNSVQHRDEDNLKKITTLSKKIKGSSDNKIKSMKNQNELNNGSLEQLKFLSSPRLSSRVGERGSSKSKIAKDKYSSLELNSGDSQKLILPKLSSKKTSMEASKCVIMENQKAMESDLNQTIDSALNSYSKLNEPGYQVSGIKDALLPERDIGDSKNIGKTSTDEFTSASCNMEITYVEKEISEKESVEIYGHEGVRGVVHKQRKGIESPSDQNRLIDGTEKSLSISDKSFRRGGQMGADESVIHHDVYDVFFLETQRDSDPKVDEEQPAEPTPETTEVEVIEPPAPFGSSSQITLAGGDADPALYKYEEAEEEELPKELKGEEEDCTAEPCNEPGWFEEYGIDKKSRKGMEEEVKSDSSEGGEVGEPAVVDEADASVEVVQEDEDVLEAKKKKVRKARPTEAKDEEEIIEITEEAKEFESEIVRQIITVPLVTLDQIPEKERVFVEKPLSQMPMEYLKKYVGKHLVAGLAQVALLMPSDPVEYLAHWLIKERKKESLLDEFKEFKAQVREVRKKNIDEIRRKLQKEYLQNEALKRYQDGKYEPLYPTFDSSESETEIRSLYEGGRGREEETMYAMTEQEDFDDASTTK